LKQVQETVANAYTYTGREWDADAGLYYYRARWYDPGVGRFMSEDPIGFAGGEANVYRYVGNNPQHYTDPLGLLSYNEVGSLVGVNNLSGQSNELVICICWKESSFNPSAQSSASSARGLMQLTKAAAKDAGYSYDLLLNPATNIKAGTKYLALRVKWAGGNVTDGLNAFGTGSGYATTILQCEKCLKETPCEYRKCLDIVHP